MDFRAGQKKVCQDQYSFLIHNNSLFCVLCDGHGSEGHHIAKFASDYIKKYYKKHFSAFKLDAKSTISKMIQKCDKKILNDMDCDLSGSTCVILFIENGIVYCASIGDSRAIIGSLSSVADVPIIRKNKYFRKVVCDRKFKAVQISIDQKPELADELYRIRMAGGVVEKYSDGLGRNIGPFRVWSKDGAGPGLAMSRSLGDRVGNSCGIISLPLYQDRAVEPGKDQYIIIGSDGIWDVLDNVEVVNFVEK